MRVLSQRPRQSRRPRPDRQDPTRPAARVVVVHGGGDGAGGRPKKGEDPEIAKIMVQRDALLTSRKWSSEITVLSKKVSNALEAAKGYEGTEEFLDHSFGEIRVAVMFCVWVSG